MRGAACSRDPSIRDSAQLEACRRWQKEPTATAHAPFFSETPGLVGKLTSLRPAMRAASSLPSSHAARCQVCQAAEGKTASICLRVLLCAGAVLLVFLLSLVRKPKQLAARTTRGRRSQGHRSSQGTPSCVRG